MKSGFTKWTCLLLFAAALLSCTACTADGQPPTDSPGETEAKPPTREIPDDEVDPAPRQMEQSQVDIRVEAVLTGLEVPWGLDFAPNGDLFLTERPGRIRVRTLRGELKRFDVDETVQTSEGGLLGLALHPEFRVSPFVYVYQTYRAADGSLLNRILRFHYDEGTGELTDRTVVFDGIPAASIHDGGQMLFGPDGKLYVSTGDANRAEDAQNPDVLNGKILRLNPDGSIPEDNPFGPDNAVYSYGHRNPEGLAFHPETGQLYSVEHGSDRFDEVNRILAGENYGWPLVRGTHHGRYVQPLAVYDPIIAPAGASFYRGPIVQWEGNFFFGTLGFDDRAGRHLHRIRFDEDGKTVAEEEVLFRNEYGRIRTVKAGPDGCLYFGTSNRDGRGSPTANDDRILRACAEP